MNRYVLGQNIRPEVRHNRREPGIHRDTWPALRHETSRPWRFSATRRHHSSEPAETIFTQAWITLVETTAATARLVEWVEDQLYLAFREFHAELLAAAATAQEHGTNRQTCQTRPSLGLNFARRTSIVTSKSLSRRVSTLVLVGEKFSRRSPGLLTCSSVACCGVFVLESSGAVPQRRSRSDGGGAPLLFRDPLAAMSANTERESGAWPRRMRRGWGFWLPLAASLSQLQREARLQCAAEV